MDSFSVIPFYQKTEEMQQGFSSCGKYRQFAKSCSPGPEGAERLQPGVVQSAPTSPMVLCVGAIHDGIARLSNASS
jgi:hypothetical protein